ncbi:hypothetical protein [Cardinium endosymbiont of Bemisia tabaci]|uniref:hypothetical protein n=1 Tax=Cardinium endosymbiont of Bemisia tabaci TaxID=672794 RepID=UPI000442D2C4|nr:hypothetical protein [Cardinium endosymbiont of Bemisia tabaci]CDG49558.1 Hypothetical protein CHV_a0239 [Cardinium endosymbiont cBtQ1 of Bemisia tabaci]
MKCLLRKALFCCATLLLTGRSCKETIPSKFKSTKKPMHSDRILNNHQACQQNKLKDQAILKTIDITMQEAFEMEACLKECLTKLGSLDHREKRVESHSTSTMAKHHADNGEAVQCSSRSIILEKTEAKQIPNIRPSSKREAIEPIKLFTLDFQSNVANVHKHIPDIKKLGIDKMLKTIEDRINMIIDIRKKDNDGQLTDEQKEKLRDLKVIVKKEHGSCWRVIQFYKQINDDINNTSGKIGQRDLESYLNEAKSENNALSTSNIIQDINKLMDMMKINKPLE